jgi:hypothetical protein
MGAMPAIRVKGVYRKYPFDQGLGFSRERIKFKGAVYEKGDDGK